MVIMTIYRQLKKGPGDPFYVECRMRLIRKHYVNMCERQRAFNAA
nr:MAG TPA: hypothetical protein [Bacteriophage sp.]